MSIAKRMLATRGGRSGASKPVFTGGSVQGQSFRIEGAEELMATLKSMGETQALKSMRGAVRSGATVIKNAANMYAPVGARHGERWHPNRPALKGSIKTASAVSWEQGVIAVYVGPDKKVFYADFVERGHAMVPRGRRLKVRKGATRTERAAKYREKYGSELGFVPAQPYMRPAFDSHNSAAQQRAGQFLKRSIRRWQLKQARGKK